MTMKRFFKKNWSLLLSFFFCAVLGTLSHFMYSWSGNSPYLAPLVPIDESIFEHLKMLMYPVVFITLIEALMKKKNPLFMLGARSFGIAVGCIGLTCFFFLYTGFSPERSIVWIDIVSYYVFLGFIYLISELSERKWRGNRNFEILGFVLFLGLIVLFSFYTYYKPDCPIFIDYSQTSASLAPARRIRTL